MNSEELKAIIRLYGSLNFSNGVSKSSLTEAAVEEILARVFQAIDDNYTRVNNKCKR